jgi:hypothetical protein
VVLTFRFFAQYFVSRASCTTRGSNFNVSRETLIREQRGETSADLSIGAQQAGVAGPEQLVDADVARHAVHGVREFHDRHPRLGQRQDLGHTRYMSGYVRVCQERAGDAV